MNVLLLGGSGLLGSALRASVPASVTLAAPAHATLDVRDASAVRDAIAALRPEWIVDCVAFTAVDRAESEREAAHELNVTQVELVAAAATAVGARVLLPSTDYVFDGSTRRPMREEDAVAPQSVYARTKRDGERVLLDGAAQGIVLRTSWLFGEGGRNFPAMMWTRARARQPSRVVDDQWGTPTHTADLARWCWALMAREARGLVHASLAGETTWAELARRVYARAGFAEGVTGVSSAEYGAAAVRPLYSVLDCARLESLLGERRRSWETALVEFLDRRAMERAA